ncbi:hypothetical protein RKE29_10380 [Streptomyces sp. B1866]|uniref:DUF6801 domain-containing protein n=1 Tax=Streptomyces sp. B1866 TaxID=3075431 RepID=UPI002890F19B|nr:DUF6801 domain-containing protein [Streptomyces sp. B1866]MDT3397046.1 hypothetical protein [Streptomyces sp. B1866]
MRGAVRQPRTAWVAALGATALFAELLTGSGSSAHGQGGGSAVRYACQTPEGSREIQAAFTQTFPDSGAAGQPIQPGPLTARVTIPHDTAAALLPQGTGSVSGTAALTARVAQGDATADAQWPGLAASSAPLPASGDLELAYNGDVQPVTVTQPGDVRFAAGKLTLALLPEPASTPGGASPGGSTPSGGESAAQTPQGSPSASGEAKPVEVSCTPVEGEAATLATVAVPDDGGASPDPSGSGSSSSPTDGTQTPGQDGSQAPQSGPGRIQVPQAAPAMLPCTYPMPTGELNHEWLPPVPPGAKVQDPPTSGKKPACVFTAGFATVTKLKGSMIINDPSGKPGPLSLSTRMRAVLRTAAQGGAYSEADHLGELHFPDSRSTFLAFGFQPTTAGVTFENGPLTIVQQTAPRVYSQITYAQRLRLHHVSINGVSLDVGPSCRTGSFTTRVTGNFSLFQGGVLTGKVNVPPFSGCRTPSGEDLDALFTASVAGESQIKINQGAVRLCPATGQCTAQAPTLPRL